MIKEIDINESFIEEMKQYREPVDRSKGLVYNSSLNIVVFAERVLGMRLYSWQVKFLTKIAQEMDKPEGQREFTAITSRQIGKSTAVAVFTLWATLFNKYPGTLGNNTLVGIVSASDTQAKKLLHEINKLIHIGDMYVKNTYKDSEGDPEFGETFLSQLIDEKADNNKTTISFQSYDAMKHGEYFLKGSKSGSVIKSYPPTSVVLGETFSIIIVDEAGKTDRITDTFFYDYLNPTGNSTNALRIYTSTPWVSSGFFYRMVDPDNIYGESPSDVVLFTVDAIELENPNYHKVVLKTIDQLNKDNKGDEVQRAYYCRFVKGELSYFDPDDVFRAFDGSFDMFENFLAPCDMGVDFGGQTTSRTVVTISYIDSDGIVRRIYHRAYGVQKDLTLLEDIAELRQRFNIQRIIPDDCPAGNFLIRKMIDVGWEVHPMNFKADKIKKYGAFRSALKNKRIYTYQDDDLKTEMLGLEFKQGVQNTMIEHAPGGTDDLIDSFLMSCYFFVQEENDFEMLDVFDGPKVKHGQCPACGSRKGGEIVQNGKKECRECKYIF